MLLAPLPPRPCVLLLVFLWLICLPWVVVSSNKNSSSSIDDVSIQESLVRWIRQQEGGFFNDKQEFRRVIPGDPSSPFGIFVASSVIPKGQVLVSIPWKNILTAGLDEFDTGLHCHTIRLLFDEMKRVQQQGGNASSSSSDFLPYIEYLQSLPPVDIPSTWSMTARTLLERMLLRGTALPPKYATTWVSHDWLQDCEGSVEQIQAAMLVLTRGDDDVLIPIYDLYNHRNGKWFNTRSHVVQDVKYELTASRDLQQGEEIYNSYNHCAQCYNRHLHYGTAEIFRDYGFVEQYPQRWIFPKHSIAFDVDVNEEEDGNLVLEFLEGPRFRDTFQVTEKALEFLQQESNRLQQFYKETLEPLLLLRQETSSSTENDATTTTIKPSELKSIVQYYEALSLALQMAVQAGKDYDFSVNDSNDDDDSDDDDDDDDEEIVVVPQNDISLQLGVVEWLRINGGTFHRNQEIRRERPAGDSSSLIGVFAKEDIDEGETLLLVPSELVLQPATDPDYQDFFCDSAQFIAREMKLGQDSFFAPYIRYLLAAPPVSIPSTWSSQGQQLFLQVTDHGKLPPDDAIQWVSKWKRDCKITNNENPLEKQAAMLLLTRGDDDALTPVYDMYNHRNAPYFNAHSYLEHDRMHAIVAHRNIQKGEQIYLSYNHCLQCDNRYYSYGTPELLRDYGFVESFPQRWIFFSMQPKIAFDIVESPNKDLELIWLDGRVDETFGELYQVTQQGVDALESQLQRLLILHDKVLQPLVNNDDQSTIPKNELGTILRYYESLVRALDMAVKAHKTYDYDSSAGALDVDKQGNVQEVVTVRKTNDLDNEDDNDDEEDDDDDEEDDEWSTDGDCPGGLYVKGRCVTDIKKWEEL
jgi:hypothetical protein